MAKGKQPKKTREQLAQEAIDSFRSAWKDYARAREVQKLAKDSKVKTDPKAYNDIISWGKKTYGKAINKNPHGAGDIVLDDLAVNRVSSDWYETSQEIGITTGNSNLEGILNAIPLDALKKNVINFEPAPKKGYEEVFTPHANYATINSILMAYAQAPEESRDGAFEKLSKQLSPVIDARMARVGTSNAKKLADTAKFIATINPAYAVGVLQEESEIYRGIFNKTFDGLSEAKAREYTFDSAALTVHGGKAEMLYDILYKALPKARA